MLNEYIAVKENSHGFNCIAFSVSYKKASGMPEKRGYYLLAIPMKRTFERGFIKEEYEPFSGKSYRLSTVKRASKAAEKAADNKALDNKAWIINDILVKYGLELQEV